MENMKKHAIAHLIALAVNLFIIYCLYQWTYTAFVSPDVIDKPIRPFARLVLSAFLASLLLTTQAVISIRQSR